VNRLRLGLIPHGSDTGAVERVDAFAEGLGATLGAAVELHEAGDYRALVAAFEQKRVDFAWMPPLIAARAMRSHAAYPAAIAVRNGATSYMTGLLAMRKSKVESLDDLVGVRVAWVDRESASGYVVIRAALRSRGVSLADAFAEELFVGSHAEVACALREGRADVGGTCFNFVEGTFDIAHAGYEEGGVAHDAVRILAHAGPIPSDVFGVGAGVDPRHFNRVQRALVDERPAKVCDLAKVWMHADAFVRPSPPHLRMVESFYEVLDSPSGAI
jgi:phosphonate transport system substrate-binding protein